MPKLPPPLPLDGVGEAPCGEGVPPGGGPYWALGNGCLGGAPLQIVVGVVKGEAVTTTAAAQPGVLARVDDCNYKVSLMDAAGEPALN